MILFFHWAHQLQRKDTVYLIDLLTDTEMIGRELGRGGGGKSNFLSFFSFLSILGIKKYFNSSVILILARHKSEIDNGVIFFKNNNIPISHQLFAIFNHCLTAIH